MNRNVLIILTTVLIMVLLGGCVSRIGLPTTRNQLVFLLDDAQFMYKNAMGGEKSGEISHGIRGGLLIWPKGGFNTTCERNLCLLDINGSGKFTHSAVRGRESTYAMDKPARYVLLESPDSEYVDRRSEIIHLPPLNTTSTAEIGQTMFSKINSVKYNDSSLKLAEKFTVHETTFENDVNYKAYFWSDSKDITICSNHTCLIDVSNTGSFNHYVGSKEGNVKKELSKKAPYVKEQKQEYNEDSFKYVALYQGKVGNNIKISFREFKDDMARPAFTQNIDYELNKSKPTIIGFKGLRIKVIKVTNMSIKYSVTHDYK